MESNNVKIHVVLVFDENNRLIEVNRNEDCHNLSCSVSQFAVNCPSCHYYFNTELFFHTVPDHHTDNNTETVRTVSVSEDLEDNLPIFQMTVPESDKTMPTLVSKITETTGTNKVQNKYKCPDCHISYTHKRLLTAHQKNKHLKPDNKDKDCEDCGQKFAFQLLKLRHQAGHNHPSKYFCETCSAGFWHTCLLADHINRYCNSCPKPAKCTICHIKLASKNSLNSHMAAIHHYKEYTFAQYSCKICGRGFNRETVLIRHQRIHNGIDLDAATN